MNAHDAALALIQVYATGTKLSLAAMAFVVMTARRDGAVQRAYHYARKVTGKDHHHV